jgi:hypothetical protein
MRKRANRVGKLQHADMLFSPFGASPEPTFFLYSPEFERHYLGSLKRKL